MKKVIGLFKEEQNADTAIKELQNAGFEENRFGVVTRDTVVQKVNRQEDEQQGTIQAPNKLGATGGAAVGGLTGLLVSAGSLAIPGIGPVVAAGSLSIAAATGMGAAAGGLLGALTGMGISEEDVDYYAQGIKRGGILVVVDADDERANFTRDVMQKFDAVQINVHHQAQQTTEQPTADEKVAPEAG